MGQRAGMSPDDARSNFSVATFSVETLLGPWSKVLKDHFASDGIYDQIAAEKK
jgi:ABC-type sulfate transport system substrate-binding protein